MANQWYVRLAGKAEGPLTGPQLKQLAAAGRIVADTPVRSGEGGAWSRADHVPGLLGSHTSKPAQNLLRAKPLAPAPQAVTAAKPAVVRAVATAAPAVVRAVQPSAASTPAMNAAEVRRERRRGNPVPMIAAVSVIGLLALMGGAGVVIAIMASSTVEEVAEPESPVPPPQLVSTPQTPASGEAVPETASSSAEPADTATSPEQVMAAIKSWKPAINSAGVRGGVQTSKIKLQFGGAWLGTDAERDSGGPELVSPGARPKYVFVRLAITNRQADQPLAYAGWNSGGLEQRALMRTDAEEFLELVPLTESSSNRLTNASIAPRETATDVLIFALHEPEFQHLRLALPFAGVGHFGFQIEKSLLTKPGQPDDANELVIRGPEENDPVLGTIAPSSPANSDPPLKITPPEETAPIESAPNAQDSPEDNGATFDDLQRSIKETAGDGQPAEKAPPE